MLQAPAPVGLLEAPQSPVGLLEAPYGYEPSTPPALLEAPADFSTTYVDPEGRAAGQLDELTPWYVDSEGNVSKALVDRTVDYEVGGIKNVGEVITNDEVVTSEVESFVTSEVESVQDDVVQDQDVEEPGVGQLDVENQQYLYRLKQLTLSLIHI